MNSQREAFEKSIQHNELAMRLRNCHYNSEYGGYYENSDPECTEPDVNSAYTRFCDGWQAATEQGVGQTLVWREYTVQPAESLAGIAARQLGDESRAGEIGLLNNLVWEDVGLYPFNPGDAIKLPVTRPSKPTGGGVPDTECPECGSTDLRWHCGQQVATGVSDGNLRLNDVSTVFFLGCEVCSETIETKTGIEIAALLATQQPPEQE